MKRIIKIRESIFKYLIILLGIALVFMNIKMYENIGARNGSKLVSRYYIYMNVLVLILSFIEGKIVKYRVKDLDLNYIKPYGKSSIVKYCILFIGFIAIAWCINIGMIIRTKFLRTVCNDMIIVMIVQYISMKISMYIKYKVMYRENILVIGNKLYDIEGIKSIRDDFGSNFYMEVGSKEYEIFCGQLSTKKELMNILCNKITSN
ncbi:hypothetical protein [Tepidibacter mesophilus]|uniref:hypothetical protein n=1 Tax=Tepidibacter mesophilus TaxID=655607 RepID=UPI000C086B18|nr:hypothetical protein [Tepidibacter mesophilus]